MTVSGPTPKPSGSDNIQNTGPVGDVEAVGSGSDSERAKKLATVVMAYVSDAAQNGASQYSKAQLDTMKKYASSLMNEVNAAETESTPEGREVHMRNAMTFVINIMQEFAGTGMQGLEVASKELDSNRQAQWDSLKLSSQQTQFMVLQQKKPGNTLLSKQNEVNTIEQAKNQAASQKQGILNQSGQVIETKVSSASQMIDQLKQERSTFVGVALKVLQQIMR
jgi:hypothetical protein